MFEDDPTPAERLLLDIVVLLVMAAIFWMGFLAGKYI